ncbi:MAG: hypothetical protein HYR68_07765 [Burkholderiales bacterium]|nr:hypothetical protein [Burkholderiales bacterium]MBI3728464.1 hypothetical protein [Burkholderiales bacterium]
MVKAKVKDMCPTNQGKAQNTAIAGYREYLQHSHGRRAHGRHFAFHYSPLLSKEYLA